MLVTHSRILTPRLPMLKNDTLIRALLRQPTAYTPVWMMRQAGRYLPEYNATRARAGSFLALAKNPDLATEVTLQPLARFPTRCRHRVLRHPDRFRTRWGWDWLSPRAKGPYFERPLREEREIRALAVPDPDEACDTCFDAVRQVRRRSPATSR